MATSESTGFVVSPRRTMGAPSLGVMNFLNEVAAQYPSAISFAPGRPIESLFRVADALAHIERYAEHQAEALGIPAGEALDRLGQYGRTNGIIHALVAQHLAVDEGIEVDPEAIVMTSGAQEAMTILLLGLFEPGHDVLLVSDPSYIGITGMADILGIDVEPVPTGPSGLEPSMLASAIARVRASGKNPKAIYDIPDFNNPMGTRLPLAARRELLAVAEAERVLVIEDNPYGMFAYDTARAPTLKSLDARGQVVYLGTFSKTLFPGLRLGYMVADTLCGGAGGAPLSHELSKVKSLTTVNTSGLLQAAAGGILMASGGSLVAASADKIAFCRANRDALLSGLARTFGVDPLLSGRVRWNRPAGGFFLTLELPFECAEAQVRTCARDYGVICCPMSFFSRLPGRERHVRLAFSYVETSLIEEGVQRLWRFVHETAPELEGG